MNEYCIFAQYCYYEYSCLHSSTCVAPARDSPLFSNEPIFPQTFGEDFAPPPLRASILRRWMLHHLLHRREHQSFEDGCCTTLCCEPAGEATWKRLFRIHRDSVYSRGGAPHCMIFTSRQYSRERYSAQGPRTEEGLGDTTVQDCSTRQQHRSSEDGCCTICSCEFARESSRKRRSIKGGASSRRRRSLVPVKVVRLKNQDFPRAFYFPYLSRRGQVRVRFGKFLAILTPPSYHPLPPDASHLGRVFPSSPSLPLCCIPRPARLDIFGPCRPAEGSR